MPKKKQSGKGLISLILGIKPKGEYKNGKKGVIGLFMGEVMKLSKGKADPKLANKLLQIELEK